MTSMREIADKALFEMGYANYSLKVKECSACKQYPAYDVWVRQEGSKRGKHVLTLVCQDFRIC